MEFANPVALSGVIVCLLALALFAYGFVKRINTARATLSPSIRALLAPVQKLRYWLRALSVSLALALLIVAIAKPLWGTERRDIDRQGRDILVLLDVSISMLAEDARPNRLSVAIAEIRDFVNRVREVGGHRIALVAFAGRATPVAPLTVDYDLYLNRLQSVSTLNSLRRGSQIGDAIRHALYSFGTLAHEYTDIVLISDGEDHGSAPLDIARVAAELGVTIHTVGIGDSTQGARIPSPDDVGAFVKVNNTEIISRMQPGLLVELARITRGQFVPLSTTATTAALGNFYEKHIDTKAVRKIDGVPGIRKVHRFQWFVALALALLLVDILLGAGKISVPHRLLNYRIFSETQTIPILAVVLLSYSVALVADSEQVSRVSQDGNQAWQRGDFHLAAKHFSEAARLSPDSAVAHFNYATTRVKLYDYAAAIKHFSVALQGADRNLASRINYNLGVVKHQQAIGNMMTFQDAMTPLELAIDYYRESIADAPNASDTRYNLELAHKLMQDLIAQRVLPQANAKTRDQKTSDNKGQLHQEQGNRSTDALPDQNREQQQKNEQSTEGEMASKQTQSGSNSQSTLVQRGEASDMSPEDAMNAVQLARQRAESMTEQRAQWRQARMETDNLEKFW